jgi:hypothetical protein
MRRGMSLVVACVVLLGATDSLAVPKKKKPKGKTEKIEKVEATDKTEKAEKADKADKTDATEKADEPGRPAGDPRNKGGAVVESGGGRGPSRIEFDDRLVQGQTNKANAIYLFERRESALRSLLKKRENFHDEIDEQLER